MKISIKYYHVPDSWWVDIYQYNKNSFPTYTLMFAGVVKSLARFKDGCYVTVAPGNWSYCTSEKNIDILDQSTYESMSFDELKEKLEQERKDGTETV